MIGEGQHHSVDAVICQHLIQAARGSLGAVLSCKLTRTCGFLRQTHHNREIGDVFIMDNRAKMRGDTSPPHAGRKVIVRSVIGTR